MKRVASFLYFFFIMTPALGLGAMIDGVSSNQFRRHFLHSSFSSPTAQIVVTVPISGPEHAMSAAMQRNECRLWRRVTAICNADVKKTSSSPTERTGNP